MDVFNNSICCYLLLTVLIISNASCTSSRTAAILQDLPSDILERPKRKVSELDPSSSGAIEYMTQLREKYSDSEGSPMFEHEDDPTSVWCMMDRDMLHKAYRPKPRSPAKCTVQNRFIFNWKSVTKGESLPVQKSILRAYLKPIRRLMKTDPTTIDIDIEVQLLGEKTKYAAGSERVQVTMSTSWLELEVTEGVKQLWPPTSSNYDLEFTVNLSVDCKTVKKVPAIFIDPTEIQLSNARRRQRHESFQPLFLMFFNDAYVKEIVYNETATAEEERSDNEFPQANGNRAKRSSSCKVENYMVSFAQLYLDYIVSPRMYNARQCMGSCSHNTLTGNHQLGTNHANIMAGAYAVFKDDPHNVNGLVQTAKQPCCVPTRYSSTTLVVNVGGSLDYKVYPAMRVSECGCR